VVEPAATATEPAEVAHGLEQGTADPDEEDVRVSERASPPSNTGAPRTGPTSVSEENL
jgi:hypothetical protein